MTTEQPVGETADQVAAPKKRSAGRDLPAAIAVGVTLVGLLVERIVDVDPKTVAHEGPTYDRPYARPSWQDDLQADTSESLERP